MLVVYRGLRQLALADAEIAKAQALTKPEEAFSDPRIPADLNSYIAEVHRRIAANLTAPEQRTSSRSAVSLKIHHDGTLTDAQIIRSCDNAEADDILLSAISSAQSSPPQLARRLA